MLKILERHRKVVSDRPAVRRHNNDGAETQGCCHENAAVCCESDQQESSILWRRTICQITSMSQLGDVLMYRVRMKKIKMAHRVKAMPIAIGIRKSHSI